MGNKLSFKQYLESKEKLLRAVKTTPKQIKQYTTKTYCKVPIGENKADRKYVGIKPNYTITVEFLYENIENPDVVSVIFHHHSEEKVKPLWPSHRFVKWLIRNASEID